MTTMHQASIQMGVSHQTLSQYYQKGLITGTPIGGVVLIDPEVATKELEARGFYRRRENRRRGRQQQAAEVGGRQ